MLLDYYPGWVGGLTLTIKLISAQLSYAAAEAGLSLAILFRVSGVGWCRVAGLAETITNSVKLKLELRLSLAKSQAGFKALNL